MVISVERLCTDCFKTHAKQREARISGIFASCETHDSQNAMQIFAICKEIRIMRGFKAQIVPNSS